MAVTSIWPIKGRVDKVINYARNPEKTHDKEKLSELHEIKGVVEYAADEMKTEKRAYVTCLNLHSEETAAQEFMETKRLMHNEGGRSCYHGYQSFKADEVDADTAHSIGVALARELWGDRFQVVIATHCNTGHYHNHFVINSVSDVDGKKFYNSPADYRWMREVSDRLCREAKISVIEYPADRRANYGEWLAEKNGKPTMRSRIREDIDRAILASTTEREFLHMMKEMGYEVITRTPKGSPRVHPIVRIVDGGRNFRLDKLGEYYELDSLKQRIQNNYRRKAPFPEITEDTKAPYYQCGYIDTGVIPKFAGCVNGVQWFRERGQWADNAMQPSPGMIIFFDWDNKGSSGPQDGQADHVGIVQKVENGIVYTIEGNSGDSCRVNQYPVGYYEILGYGVVAY